MTRFRPCIDLHNGQVKQIVGSSLNDADAGSLVTNFTSDLPPAHYAELYRDDALHGGHVIKLGPDNDAAARSALAAFPGGLQIGGGIHPGNVCEWLEAGASHVIATSCLFDGSGRFSQKALDELLRAIGGKERLVIDLSCRRTATGWTVAMNRWQTLTNLPITQSSLSELADQCAEFLIHAADVEGKCEGIDEALVDFLGEHATIPTTYAGGARSIDDLSLVNQISAGRVDLAIGSALDIFGGSQIRYRDCVTWNQSQPV